MFLRGYMYFLSWVSDASSSSIDMINPSYLTINSLGGVALRAGKMIVTVGEDMTVPKLARGVEPLPNDDLEPARTNITLN